MKSAFGRAQGDDGWSVSGDASDFGWKSRGGHPGGYFSWTDAATGSDVYFEAPDKFEGHRGGFYGGALSYDIFDSGADYAGAPDVRIVGSNGVALVASLGQPGTGWTHESIALDTSGGWRLDTLDGAPATRADIRHVLRDISALEIRAEYVSGPENGGLDNVTMVKAPAHAAVFGPDTTDFGGFAHHDVTFLDASHVVLA